MGVRDGVKYAVVTWNAVLAYARGLNATSCDRQTGQVSFGSDTTGPRHSARGRQGRRVTTPLIVTVTSVRPSTG